MRRHFSAGPGLVRATCTGCLLLLAGVALAGCSPGSTPGQQQQPTSPSDLREKVSLIEADPCYTANPRTIYQSCGARYLTEINNAALVAQGVIATTPANGSAGGQIDIIRNKIDDFNGRSCASAPASLADTCAADLRAINVAFDRLGKALPASEPAS
jgi:hypothetical protein